MDARLDRRLGWALAISLAAHGLALTPGPRLPAAEGSAPLRATLRQDAAPRQASSPQVPAPDKAVEPPTRQALPEPVERSYERPDSAPQAAPSRSGEGPREAQPATAAGPASQAEGPAPAAPEAAPVQPPRPTVDLHGLRQYHLALSRVAARFKRYPAQAREAGQEGRVPVRLAVSEAGIPIGLVLIGTSGSTALDQAALEMMGMAAAHTPVPESLRGRDFTIDLVVNYNLRDEE